MVKDGLQTLPEPTLQRVIKVPVTAIMIKCGAVVHEISLDK